MGIPHCTLSFFNKSNLNTSKSIKMVEFTKLALCVILSCMSVSAQKYQCNPDSAGLSDNCIGCICEASTNCNKTAQCISGDSFCGPFLISRGFWIDAGSCVLENDNPNDPAGLFTVSASMI